MQTANLSWATPYSNGNNRAGGYLPLFWLEYQLYPHVSIFFLQSVLRLRICHPLIRLRKCHPPLAACWLR